MPGSISATVAAFTRKRKAKKGALREGSEDSQLEAARSLVFCLSFRTRQQCVVGFPLVRTA